MVDTQVFEGGHLSSRGAPFFKGLTPSEQAIDLDLLREQTWGLGAAFGNRLHPAMGGQHFCSSEEILEVSEV